LRLAAGLRFPQLMPFAIALRLSQACRGDAEMPRGRRSCRQMRAGASTLDLYCSFVINVACHNRRATIIV
jgi:hypothetical protein